MNTVRQSARQRRAPAHGAGLLIIAALFATGCDRDVTGPSLAQLIIQPDSAELFPGDSLRLTPELLDHRGSPFHAVQVTWSSSDTALVAVDAHGLIQAKARGRATVIAAAGTIRDSVIVDVRCTVDILARELGVVIGGSNPPLDVEFDCGSGGIAWSSQRPEVVTVDSTGRVSGEGPGHSYVYAASRLDPTSRDSVLFRNFAYFRIIPHITSLQVGESVQFRIDTREPVRWTSSDTTVLRIDQTGRAVAVAPGRVEIYAHSLTHTNLFTFSVLTVTQ